MKRYFDTIDTLNSFTLSLDYHREELDPCCCGKDDQFVAHGFVYKQRSQILREVVGKRILCSNRYGRSGCGRTLRLYLATEVPSLHHTTAHLFVFISSLIAGMTIQRAYQKATATADSRNAYRWLNKLDQQLIVFRSVLHKRPADNNNRFTTRSRRLLLLLPTLRTLLATLDPQYYQLIHQTAFV